MDEIVFDMVYFVEDAETGELIPSYTIDSESLEKLNEEIKKRIDDLNIVGTLVSSKKRLGKRSELVAPQC